MRGRREPPWRRHRRLALVRRHLDPLPADLPSSAGGIWAVGLVRDEVDVIGPVVANLLAQGVERVVVADNLSNDGTTDVLTGMAGRSPVTVLSDRLAAYYQAEKMTLLARLAASAGAGWVLPFDADEVWLAPGTTLASWLAACSSDVVQVPVFNHVPTAGDDLSEPDPLRRLRWRKAEPNQLHKVVFRADPRARLHQGNHGVDRPGSRCRGLEIRHFPYRSRRQFVRKLRQGSAALVAGDVDRELGKHWRPAAEASDEELSGQWDELVETHNRPMEWWVPRHGLVEDPVELPRPEPGP